MRPDLHISNIGDIEGLEPGDVEFIMEEIGRDEVIERGKTRSCGDCIVCCVWPVRPEGHLPASASTEEQVPCVQLVHSGDPDGIPVSGRGCLVYDDRPEMCRTYKCAWRSGMFANEGMRPDISGILVEPRENEALGVVFKFTWLREGAEETHLAEQAMCVLAQVAIVMTGRKLASNETMSGPAVLLEEAVVLLRAGGHIPQGATLGIESREVATP